MMTQPPLLGLCPNSGYMSNSFRTSLTSCGGIPISLRLGNPKHPGFPDKPKSLPKQYPSFCPSIFLSFPLLYLNILFITVFCRQHIPHLASFPFQIIRQNPFLDTAVSGCFQLPSLGTWRFHPPTVRMPCPYTSGNVKAYSGLRYADTMSLIAEHNPYKNPNIFVDAHPPAGKRALSKRTGIFYANQRTNCWDKACRIKKAHARQNRLWAGLSGGECGIRTHVPSKGQPHFECGSL